MSSDDDVDWGDMMMVRYAAAGGRECPFDEAALERRLRAEIVADLIGLELTGFRALSRRLFGASEPHVGLPNSAKYALSEALLAAVASASGCSMAEVICADYDVTLLARPVPIFCQSGEERKTNVDKMILRHADALPHGLINNPAIRPEAAELAEYLRWVRDRILAHGAAGGDRRWLLHRALDDGKPATNCTDLRAPPTMSDVVSTEQHGGGPKDHARSAQGERHRHGNEPSSGRSVRWLCTRCRTTRQ